MPLVETQGGFLPEVSRNPTPCRATARRARPRASRRPRRNDARITLLRPCWPHSARSAPYAIRSYLVGEYRPNKRTPDSLDTACVTCQDTSNVRNDLHKKIDDAKRRSPRLDGGDAVAQQRRDLDMDPLL